MSRPSGQVRRRRKDSRSRHRGAFASGGLPADCSPKKGAERRDGAVRLRGGPWPGCEPGRSNACAALLRAPCDRSPRASRRSTAVPGLCAPVRVTHDRHGVEAALTIPQRRISSGRLPALRPLCRSGCCLEPPRVRLPTEPEDRVPAPVDGGTENVPREQERAEYAQMRRGRKSVFWKTENKVRRTARCRAVRAAQAGAAAVRVLPQCASDGASAWVTAAAH
jgi:hypothetical protein